MIKIEVNNKTVHARKGETILSALRSAGIQVPTLCSMDDLSPTGACRMCVVEVEGYESLVPACSRTVEEWMKIKTHTPRVLKARKTNVELLLSNHPDDCLYCERNGNCELQKLAEDLNVRERRITSTHVAHKIDNSSQGIVRDPAKCILCGRCVRVCEEIVGISTLDFIRRGDSLQIAPAMSEPMYFSNCIDCGQCVILCPTGALTEKPDFPELGKSLNDPDKVVAVQYTPAAAVMLGDAFGMKPGTNIQGLMNAALRRMGFDYIFDTSFGADVFVMEQAEELIQRVTKKENLPLISSSCPAWIKYVEQFDPDLLHHLTPVRSPQQIVGQLIKTWFAKLNHIPANRIHSVLITSCVAAKYEAKRPEYGSKGFGAIDFVLTVREFARFIRLHGIDFSVLEEEPADGPFHAIGSSGRLTAVAGGETESTLRTLYPKIEKKEQPSYRLSKIRNRKDVLESVLATRKGDIRVAAVSGLNNAIKLIREVKSGKSAFDFIEVMACPEGCVNGGGQPIPGSDEKLKARIKAVYDADKKETVKVAHKNPAVLKMYEDFARSPMSQDSRKLFCTHYAARKVMK
jgi:NADH-quinone oxidoreductase subunit G/NADP-reducing hydrogenase subunit HndD